MKKFWTLEFRFWSKGSKAKKVTGLGSVFCALLVAVCVPVQARAAKAIRIGELVFRVSDRANLGRGRDLFRRELRALGYIEGKNIVFEVRSAEGRPERFPALAKDLT